jgi:transposase
VGFTLADIRRLTKALKGAAEARVYRRLQAVLWVAQGRGISEVALLTGASRRSIYGWVSCYLGHHHPEELREGPRSGRPRAAPAITDRRIARELRRDPLRLGYSATAWTVPLLAAHLSARSQCAITERTLRRRLKQLGLRWKRPRYVYAENDPHRAQKKGLWSDD